MIFFFEPMTLQQFLILIGAGAGAAVGQFGITAAYKYAPAREISIYCLLYTSYDDLSEADIQKMKEEIEYRKAVSYTHLAWLRYRSVIR